jgi:hypothetical protein
MAGDHRVSAYLILVGANALSRERTELVSRIVTGDSAMESGCSLSVPTFVSKIIEQGQSLDSNAKLSFADIFETLKNNDFRILEGVDPKEVLNFVSGTEFTEALTEQTKTQHQSDRFHNWMNGNV